MPRSFLLAALLALAAPVVQATPRLEQVYPALAANPSERAFLFTGDDRQAIDTFFRRHVGHGADLKQFSRSPLLVRDRLPDSLARRRLPQALDNQLRSLPGGYERMIVGRDVVLLDLRSYTILDIMRDVVR